MSIAKSLTDLIGKTPLLELSNYEQKQDVKAKLIAKLEYFNPAGSVKDRIANYRQKKLDASHKKKLLEEEKRETPDYISEDDLI